MMFDRIPLVVFHLIHTYLTHHDYLQLVNTSKDVFAEVKQETVYYNLKQFGFQRKSISSKTS
jgi:hypothetical protein